MANGKYDWRVEQPHLATLRDRNGLLAIKRIVFAAANPLPADFADGEFSARLHKYLSADPETAALLHFPPATLTAAQREAVFAAIRTAAKELHSENELRLAAALRRLAAVAGPHLDTIAECLTVRGNDTPPEVRLQHALKSLGVK